MLVGIARVMEGMETSYLDVGSHKYKVSNKKVRNSFNKGKTFYQNPNINEKISYYNKRIVKRNRLSYISLKGKEIKANNNRKNIEKKFKNKWKE